MLLPLSSTNEAKAGEWRVVTYLTPESNRKVTDQEVAFLERFKELGTVERGFNWLFFTSGDSREPELAGIRGALVGTALTLLVTLALCLPIGVLAAVYLEEFAPKNRLTSLIEVNINNLAAVPSIVFGLLGLAVFLNFFGLPRSAPLVGGLVLALLVLPTIIIAGACRAQGRAAVHQGGGARRRRVPPAGRVPSRAAAGHAGYHDRHDHRHGARAGRDCAAADDRHDRIYRRCAEGLHGSRDRAAGADLSMVGSARKSRSRRRPRRPSSCFWYSFSS